MLERLKVRLWKLAFRLFPAYRGTGGRVTHIEPDWSRVEVELPLSWRTRNYVGTIYGGSMYGCVDPIYMLMLIRRLGDDYTVWDKAAEIRFKQPGESTLYAAFELPDSEVDDIRESLAPGESLDREYQVELVDEAGVVHAEVDKTLYVRRDD
jgi:acyl-coenzyme A thioesterase PaaI-like protein